MLDFATTDFDKENTSSQFIYRNDSEPKHLYRHDSTKFELREIIEQKSTTIICELNIQDIDEETIDVRHKSKIEPRQTTSVQNVLLNF